jgi:hypothetical protein
MTSTGDAQLHDQRQGSLLDSLREISKGLNKHLLAGFDPWIIFFDSDVMDVLPYDYEASGPRCSRIRCSIKRRCMIYVKHSSFSPWKVAKSLFFGARSRSGTAGMHRRSSLLFESLLISATAGLLISEARSNRQLTTSSLLPEIEEQLLKAGDTETNCSKRCSLTLWVTPL